MEAAFGTTALTLMGMGDGMSLNSFARERLKAVVLHEVGHDFGLSHNFIGHNAYTASELKSRSFTLANGTSSSVMDYWPVNVWPKGTSHGTYFPLVLGPYDYHVIHWGYAGINELRRLPTRRSSTLSRWASAAVNPRYAFAGDEDGFFDGHAIDPRIAPFMATNQPIDWCTARSSRLDATPHVASRSPLPRKSTATVGRRARGLPKLPSSDRYRTCATAMTHYAVAAERLTLGRLGDPGVKTPLSPVPRAEEQRAYQMLGTYMFADRAWQLSPTMLNRLVYTEYIPFANFGYDPPARHDVPIVELIGTLQNRALGYMFSPLVLQRLADLPLKARPGETMTLADLFTWTQASVFGDLTNGRPGTTQVHRNLQRRYAHLLGRFITAPPMGTPYDAQTLARHELLALSDGDVRRDLARKDLDLQTRAHLEAMAVDASRSLDARQVVPISTGG